MAVSYIPSDSMCCLSSDTKPTSGIENGQCIIEMDTGNAFIFSADDKEWYPL